MREQPRWRRYLRFWGPDVEADIDDELRFHLEMRERDGLAAGLPPAAAREEALARFGDPEKVRRWLRAHDSRRLRQDRRSEILNELTQDVRYGLRRLRLAPGFTLAVVLVLGLGIGATTAIFSVLDAALLRPLPYPEPERLVAVADLQSQGETPSSFSEYADWKQATDVFAGLGAWWSTSYALTGTGEPEMLSTVRMSADLPRLLGVVPLAGRSFIPSEDERSAPPVVMLGEGLWRRRFASDPKIVGRAITLEGEPYTVIGVFPADRRSIVPDLLAAGQQVDIWLNLRLDAELTRDLHFLNAAGRLRSGLTLAQAKERVEALARRLRQSGATDHDIAITPLERTVIGDSRPLLTALAGAAGMVLLIACTNVASLLLARAAGRRREIAIRAALGAARGRIVRQLLVESLLLALLGGAAGALLARIGVAGLRTLGTAGVPRLDEAAVDLRMLGFALVLSLFTGLLFGLVPVLRASRPDLAEVIKTGAPGSLGGPARDRLRGALVVAEVALSFALLIGAGLLLRSLDRLLAVDKGYDAERVVSAYLNLPFSRYAEKHQQAAFFQAMRERLLALPGVREAAFASDLPLVGDTNGGFVIEGRTFPPDEQPLASKRIVSPGYFAALGTRVLAGRTFDDRDVAGATPVVVVNQAFASRYFPGEDPLGKRVDFSWETTGMQGIVGVVADLRERALAEPAQPTIYIPLAQRPDSGMFLLVRTDREPLAVVPSLRRAVYASDRDLPLSEVRTLSEIVAQGLADRRFAMSLFAAFSALALGLAAVGLYAVVSYSVQQRRQEIGIRMALGARAEQVGSTVIGRGIGLITAGAVLGALASLWLGRFLAGLIFGVGTTDPATFASVAFVLMATALLASLVPALRAARIDPARVLRSE
ncbi:MAG TPA: ABC transporter permease [Thermoanaerobaculia bacterium]|nr:ABC transporter permease [Thermoanaerobaculia bacterium]